jgi:hypothetical protein
MAKRFDQLGPAGKQIALALFCNRHKYQANLISYDTSTTPPTMVTTPNPETQAQFLTRRINEIIIEHAMQQRAIDASATVSDTDLV